MYEHTALHPNVPSLRIQPGKCRRTQVCSLSHSQSHRGTVAIMWFPQTAEQPMVRLWIRKNIYFSSLHNNCSPGKLLLNLGDKVQIRVIMNNPGYYEWVCTYLTIWQNIWKSFKPKICNEAGPSPMCSDPHFMATVNNHTRRIFHSHSFFFKN